MYFCLYDIQYLYCHADAEALEPTELVYNEVSGSILLDEVNCTGEESQLLECEHGGIGVHDCSHYQDAGAKCTGERSMLINSDPQLDHILENRKPLQVVFTGIK